MAGDLRNALLLLFALMLTAPGSGGLAQEESAKEENPKDTAPLLTEELRRAQQGLYDHIRSIRLKAEGRVRVMPGSYNSFIERRYPGELGEADYPPQELSFEVQAEVLLDFQRGRSYIKGANVVAVSQKTDEGEIDFHVLADRTESAFDGSIFTGFTPQAPLGPYAIAAGVRNPIDFRETELDPTKVKFRNWSQPVFMACGHLPETGSRVTASALRPVAQWEAWGAGANATEPVPAAIEIREAGGSGRYATARLSPELAYRPIAWSSYWLGELRRHIELSYTGSGKNAALSSWRVSTYEDGVLSQQEDFTVAELEWNPELPASAFRLSPKPGMVVARQVSGKISYEVSGEESNGISTIDENLAMLRNRSWRLTGSAGIVAVAGCGSIVWFARRRRARRVS